MLLTEHGEPPPVEQDRLGDSSSGVVSRPENAGARPRKLHGVRRMHPRLPESHGDGHSRLLREGLRLAIFCNRRFVPVSVINRIAWTAARSNTRSTVMPDHSGFLIENHCIGCSLCRKELSVCSDPDGYQARWPLASISWMTWQKVRKRWPRLRGEPLIAIFATMSAASRSAYPPARTTPPLGWSGEQDHAERSSEERGVVRENLQAGRVHFGRACWLSLAGCCKCGECGRSQRRNASSKKRVELAR